MKSLVERLPFPPQPDESVRGLVVRVAAANGCTPSEIARWLGLRRIDSSLDVDPGPVAIALGMDPGTLRVMGFAHAGREAFLGREVPVAAFSHWACRACPECLGERAYHRRVWEHSQIRACPLHRVRLLERCPQCAANGSQGAISWIRPDFSHCGEGHDLRSADCAPIPKCRGVAALHRLCGLTCAGPDLPDAFAALPFQDLVDLLFFLGRMQVVVVDGNPSKLGASAMSTDPTILEAGCEIAFSWPESFNELATAVRKSRGIRFGLGLQYGYLHRFMAACGKAPYAALVRSAYSAHLARRPDMSNGAWPDFLPPWPGLRESVTSKEAQNLLGIGQRLFLDLLKQPRASAVGGLLCTRARRQLYRKQEILKLREPTDPVLMPDEVDARLGLPRRKGKLVCEAGLLASRLGGPRRGRPPKLVVDPADIRHLLAGVLGRARAVPPADPISLNRLLARASARRVIAAEEVIRAVVDGDLVGYVSNPGAPGFACLSFDLPEGLALLEKLGDPSRTGKVQLRDVARRLGVRGGTVRQLVGAGLLPKPTVHGGLVFRTKDIDAFEKDYAFDFVLAKELAISVRRFRDEAERAGAVPAAVVEVGSRKKMAEVYARGSLLPRVLQVA